MDTTQTIDVYLGDDRYVDITIYDEDNELTDLSDKSVRFTVKRHKEVTKAEVSVSSGDDDLEIVGRGLCRLWLSTEVSAALAPGTHWFDVKTSWTDEDGRYHSRTVAQGRLLVKTPVWDGV